MTTCEDAAMPPRQAKFFRLFVMSAAGTVATEFAIVVPFLVFLLFNLVDFTLLIWAQMELDFAAQMGAQAAYSACTGGGMPALSNCAGLTAAVNQAIGETSLGSQVTLASGSPGEIYYCPSGGSLQSVSTYPTLPSPYNCGAAGNASELPGDYISIAVSYSYAPFFNGLSLVSARTMSGAAIQRLK